MFSQSELDETTLIATCRKAFKNLTIPKIIAFLNKSLVPLVTCKLSLICCYNGFAPTSFPAAAQPSKRSG